MNSQAILQDFDWGFSLPGYSKRSNGPPEQAGGPFLRFPVAAAQAK
jgi:hypothetical protein